MDVNQLKVMLELQALQNFAARTITKSIKVLYLQIFSITFYGKIHNRYRSFVRTK